MAKAGRPLCWPGRRAPRGRYAAWRASTNRLARRAAWAAEWRRRYGSLPRCVVCQAPWQLATSDLHHVSYAHLGTERFFEVWPLCRPCHQSLHALLDRQPAWRALGRGSASLALVAVLRARLPQDGDG